MDIQYAVVLTLAIAAGLVGGVVSSWLFVGTPVFAQKSEVAEVIRAKRFEMVDEDGMLRAALTLLAGEPRLFLYDKDEKVRAGLALVDGEPHLRLFDKNGKPIWTAP